LKLSLRVGAQKETQVSAALRRIRMQKENDRQRKTPQRGNTTSPWCELLDGSPTLADLGAEGRAPKELENKE